MCTEIAQTSTQILNVCAGSPLRTKTAQTSTQILNVCVEGLLRTEIAQTSIQILNVCAEKALYILAAEKPALLTCGFFSAAFLMPSKRARTNTHVQFLCAGSGNFCAQKAPNTHIQNLCDYYNPNRHPFQGIGQVFQVPAPFTGTGTNYNLSAPLDTKAMPIM